MARFMQANEGLYRRIAYTFRFSDYTPVNLAEIMEVYCRKKGFFLEEVRTPPPRGRLLCASGLLCLKLQAGPPGSHTSAETCWVP
jgi:hypothetical protein